MSAQGHRAGANRSTPATAFLVDAAIRLQQQTVGEDPAEQYTPERAAWFERHYAAADALGELAGWDADLLHDAAGPAVDVGRDPEWRALLITAACKAMNRARPTEEWARWAARGALAEAAGSIRFDWETFALEALQLALGMLRIEERRMVREGLVVDRAGAEKLLATAIAEARA